MIIGNCRDGLPVNGNKHNMKGLKMNDGKLMMEYIQDDDSRETNYTYLQCCYINFGLLIITYLVILRNPISQTFSSILNKKLNQPKVRWVASKFGKRTKKQIT